ncbi:MAG: bacteriohemerythrin [Candidatus Moraniibacteriota bacterium]
MIIPWKEEYNLGIASIDEQHKKLIGIINTLGKDLSSGLEASDINSAIVRMEVYVKEHFLYEERYFGLTNYAEATEHIAEHRIFLDKTEEFRERAKSKDSTLSIEILGYLEEWFIHHVLVVDRRYVEYFKEYGIQ